MDTNKVFLAEYGSLSLEFKYLSKHTGDPAYGKLIDQLYLMIRTMNSTDGLLPLIISFHFFSETPSPHFDRLSLEPRGNHLSMGAFGDSYYEYLLKAWLQNGKHDQVPFLWLT